MRRSDEERLTRATRLKERIGIRRLTSTKTTLHIRWQLIFQALIEQHSILVWTTTGSPSKGPDPPWKSDNTALNVPAANSSGPLACRSRSIKKISRLTIGMESFKCTFPSAPSEKPSEWR